MFKWTLLLFFLVGCGGNLNLISESELEEDTDLGLYLDQLREEGKIESVSVGIHESITSLESEENNNDVVVYQEAQENLASLDSSVTEKSEDSTISSWTQGLHAEVHQEDTGGKKFAESQEPQYEPQLSGKKVVAQSSPQADLVGGFMGSISNTNQDSSLYDVPILGTEGEFEIIGDLKTPVVDVVVVLDLSHSTKYLRRNHMKDQLKGFLKKLDPLDWRLSIINSSIGKRKGILPIGGRLFIDREIDEAVFLTTVEESKDAGQTERPLAALEDFFKSSESIDFLREDSDGLAVVIISDNDEEHLNFKGQMITSEHVLYTFHERFGYDKMIRGYSLTVVDDRCRSIMIEGAGSNEGKYAPVVTEFVDRTSGKGRSFNLCAADYSPVADTITKDFFLRERGT